jgi:hypothetical protein
MEESSSDFKNESPIVAQTLAVTKWASSSSSSNSQASNSWSPLLESPPVTGDLAVLTEKAAAALQTPNIVIPTLPEVLVEQGTQGTDRTFLFKKNLPKHLDTFYTQLYKSLSSTYSTA